MNENELLTKIDTEHVAEIFAGLYGEYKVDEARLRYKKILTEIIKNTSGEFDNASGHLRVFSAPGRTELAGNHTDHNRGKVLTASIQLDSVAIVRARKDNTVFFRSTGYLDAKISLTDSSGAPDLQPKLEEKETSKALIRGIAAGLNRRTETQKGGHTGCAIGGFSANADSTVLSGSGLSSSASIEMLLGRIFDSLYGEGKRTPLEIAQIGQAAENIYFGKPCGLMDQIACAMGGAVAINFANAANPEVKQINFNLAAAGYTLCVVNTGGSHANLTPDYAAIPAEMKNIAAFFGKSVLGELEKETVMTNAAELRKSFGDRALLRALHFFDENARVDAMTSALMEMEKSNSNDALGFYLDIVNESGDSSWKLLQNIYSPGNPETQGIAVGLALTKNFFQKQKLHGACRVHGGGFAGTIQAYIPFDAMNIYRTNIEAIFGTGSVTTLQIRQTGAAELAL
jgi:galactokinase